jgi:hypothetical protein
VSSTRSVTVYSVISGRSVPSKASVAELGSAVVVSSTYSNK